MKILKNSTLPEERIWSGYCGNCRSIAEAFEKELTGIVCNEKFMDDGHSWEICPVCGRGPYGGMLFHPKKQ